MPDGLGLLLSLPLDSIAVRIVCASVVAVVLARLLLQSHILRVARLRAAAALIPVLALAVVLLGFSGNSNLPGLWLPVEASGGLSVRVADTYVSFAPVAGETLLVAWLVVVAVRVGVRLRHWTGRHRAAAAARRAALTTPPMLRSVVRRLSSSMGITAPPTLLVPNLAGGAMVLGIRTPLLVLDAGLVARLDEAELEGVVAHELAHVARRDNLVAALLGVVRDVFFFVPGGRWSLGRLLREREHAADMLAVRVTRRPGALASGLLKVLEGAPRAAACAPLLPEGTVVDRVRVLCDDRPAPTRLRHGVETGLTLAAVAVAVGVAAQFPVAAGGPSGERDALGVLLSDAGDGSVGTAPAAAFRVYGGTVLEQADPEAVDLDTAIVVDDPADWSLERLEACAAEAFGCARPGPAPALPLRPPDVVRVDDDRIARWRLDPVVVSSNRELGLFWFQQVE